VVQVSYGRRVIYSDAKEITAENVVEEVRNAYLVHGANQAEIRKLHEIYRGKTDILSKVKEVRESINHKINENRAWEIVNFYVGYLFGEPIQYVRRENTKRNDADDEIAADINALNGHMFSAGKATCDKNLGEWMFIGGNGYRMTLPNKKWTEDGDEAPFTIRALRPAQTFIIYSTDVDEHKLAGVHVVTRENNENVFSVYTDKWYFEFTEFGGIKKQDPNPLRMIPIVEYPLEASRLGVFEVVVDLLNMLNELQSNRMDDIVQFVNSFLAVIGAELNEETYKKLEEWKTLCLPEGTDAKYLSGSLSQSDVQTLKNDILDAITEITGIPTRGNGASESSNGVAVQLRSGWQDAEARAKCVETMFKAAEAETLKLVLHILRDTVGTSLKLSDIDTHFTRRNYENIASKSQVLVAMLNNPKIHPELAFAHCGMFPDPESAYLQSMKYYEEQMEKWEPIEVDEKDDGEVNV
jgi:SPP1 family phage portal protein